MDETVTERTATGPEYLELGARLLRRVRAADPTAGLWEAADLQWWWRRDGNTDAHQRFWLDEDGQPVAATVFADWGRSRPWEYHLITLPGLDETVVERAWRSGLATVERAGIGPVEMIVRDDDAPMLERVRAAGFTATGETGATSWLDATDRPAISPLPDGFRLLTRAQTRDRPHHMIARSGEHVADRLARTELYDEELDLLVESPDGDVAAYGLFWADPHTGVGLVEPMRTEDAYQRRGLARHVLTSGLELLAQRGCTRLKVSSGKPLYGAVGFEVRYTDAVHLGPA